MVPHAPGITMTRIGEASSDHVHFLQVANLYLTKLHLRPTYYYLARHCFSLFIRGCSPIYFKQYNP
jgi:hypothetical protein